MVKRRMTPQKHYEAVGDFLIERAMRLEALTRLAIAQREVEMPPLAFDPGPQLLREVEDNIPEVAREIERFANGIPVNGAAR